MMKGLRALINGARNVIRLLGVKGVLRGALGMVFSIVLAGTEYLIAVLMVIFLVALHLMDTAQIPQWLPFDGGSLSAMGVWGCLLFVGLVRALCLFITSQTCHVILEFVRIRLKMVLGYRLLMTDQASPMAISDIHVLLEEIMPKTADFVYSSTELASTLARAAAITLAMFYVAWQETIVGIICLCFGGLLISYLNKRIAAISSIIPEESARFGQTVVRITRNWLFIKVLRMQDKEYRAYRKSATGYYKNSVRSYAYRNLSVILPPPIGLIAMAIIIHANSTVFKTPPGALIGFIYLFVRFAQTTAIMTTHIGAMSHTFFHFGESVKLFDSLSPENLSKALSGEDPPCRVESAEAETNKQANPGVGRTLRNSIPVGSPLDIELRGVTFSWPGASTPLFEDLSAIIPAGSQFGIIGPNGCGKTTLLGIILGVLKPSAGRVLIGGISSEDYFRSTNSLGYVGADPNLLRGTVRANLLYGMHAKVSDDEMLSALKMVRLETLTGENGRGLDYEIQENGEGLSSGERQRLALARAFLHNPDLLALDEASANLDTDSENEIAELLGELRGRCTIVIVSHRPGILRGVDATLELGDAGTKWMLKAPATLLDSFRVRPGSMWESSTCRSPGGTAIIPPPNDTCSPWQRPVFP